MFYYIIKNKLKNNLLIFYFLFFKKFTSHIQNIKYKYLIAYNKKMRSKKYNDEFFKYNIIDI